MPDYISEQIKAQNLPHIRGKMCNGCHWGIFELFQVKYEHLMNINLISYILTNQKNPVYLHIA